MSQVRLLFDEDLIHHDLLVALKIHRVDVLTVADVGRLGDDDESILRCAADHGRLLVSANIRDFHRIHTEWVRSGKSHWGILVIPQRHFSVGERLRRIDHMVKSHRANDLQNQIYFIEGISVPEVAIDAIE